MNSPFGAEVPELDNLKVELLAAEFKEWMRERWNHPCVAIWDAQNETFAGEKTGKAIQAVRHLDLSAALGTMDGRHRKHRRLL